MKEHRIRLADGLTLYARDYPAEGRETGAPVLCLHGLTRNSRDFEIVAPRIAALGRRVIVPDMRGRGESDRDSAPQRYAIPTYVGDCLAVLGELGLARAVWLGTSMGGLIGMSAAAVNPATVAAVVLNDVGPLLESAGLARIASYVGKSARFETWADAAAAIKDVQGAAYPGADEAFWETFARRTCRQAEDGSIALDYDPAIAAGLGTTSVAPDLRPLFAALTPIPTLVLRGALSDLLSPEGVEAMRAMKPDLVGVVVPGVGHAPTLEEPGAWLPLVDFLAAAP